MDKIGVGSETKTQPIDFPQKSAAPHKNPFKYHKSSL